MGQRNLPYAQSIFSAIDINGSGTIEFEEVLDAIYRGSSMSDKEWMKRMVRKEKQAKEEAKHRLRPEEVEEIRKIFEKYDADGSGDISRQELRDVMNRAGIFTEEEMQRMFECVHGSCVCHHRYPLSNVSFIVFARFVDEDNDDSISFDEFLKLFQPEGREVFTITTAADKVETIGKRSQFDEVSA
ncbi:CPK21 [Symbiodinium sp. KB8]|nr:CPK21 [Symbiodinium sp. KB8]